MGKSGSRGGQRHLVGLDAPRLFLGDLYFTQSGWRRLPGSTDEIPKILPAGKAKAHNQPLFWGSSYKRVTAFAMSLEMSGRDGVRVESRCSAGRVCPHPDPTKATQPCEGYLERKGCHTAKRHGN